MYQPTYNWLPVQRNVDIYVLIFQGGTHWRLLALYGPVLQCNILKNKVLICTMVFINGFMQKHMELSGKKGNSPKLFFPAIFNPPERADFCVQPNTASCVLSISKRFAMLKTTCPCRGLKNTFQSQGFV
ncbi:hypothetical protein [Mariniflexile rhizosphaerae]|uniref:hypothetical protein n=1 Tax=unclassified Mariniflexile TaxID=2643887 RepID=UPI000E3C81BE|nr:hypothetical protein [Mariniflexile sp. TRM1-10]